MAREGDTAATSSASARSAGADASLADVIPNNLRVLVVDDDPLCLKVVEHMLRRCNYHVTTCPNGLTALETLRDKSHHYDLVLSDVYMPDMDGFKLLEHIGLELDLPVIMMSSNGETSVVLRGVTHGAVDFLIKPVRIEELRNVWQHVVRRRREPRDQAQAGKGDSGDEDEADGSRRPGDKKRKERRDSDDGATVKKPRVVWSVEMHQQFVNAVNQLGIDKAVPKRILDLMNVEGLTRENVASHLQKYRLYLKRVAGVQLQSAASRGKGGKAPTAEMSFAGMMSGAPLGLPGQAGLPAMPQGMMNAMTADPMHIMQLQNLQMHGAMGPGMALGPGMGSLGIGLHGGGQGGAALGMGMNPQGPLGLGVHEAAMQNLGPMSPLGAGGYAPQLGMDGMMPSHAGPAGMGSMGTGSPDMGARLGGMYHQPGAAQAPQGGLQQNFGEGGIAASLAAGSGHMEQLMQLGAGHGGYGGQSSHPQQHHPQQHHPQQHHPQQRLQHLGGVDSKHDEDLLNFFLKHPQ